MVGQTEGSNIKKEGKKRKDGRKETRNGSWKGGKELVKYRVKGEVKKRRREKVVGEKEGRNEGGRGRDTRTHEGMEGRRDGRMEGYRDGRME